jgi:hypothetical protein
MQHVACGTVESGSFRHSDVTAGRWVERLQQRRQHGTRRGRIKASDQTVHDRKRPNVSRAHGGATAHDLAASCAMIVARVMVRDGLRQMLMIGTGPMMTVKRMMIGMWRCRRHMRCRSAGAGDRHRWHLAHAHDHKQRRQRQAQAPSDRLDQSSGRLKRSHHSHPVANPIRRQHHGENSAFLDRLMVRRYMAAHERDRHARWTAPPYQRSGAGARSLLIALRAAGSSPRRCPSDISAVSPLRMIVKD